MTRVRKRPVGARPLSALALSTWEIDPSRIFTYQVKNVQMTSFSSDGQLAMQVVPKNSTFAFDETTCMPTFDLEFEIKSVAPDLLNLLSGGAISGDANKLKRMAPAILAPEVEPEREPWLIRLGAWLCGA